MRYYCTLFDVNYLPNFLALYDSLLHTSTKLKIYAFCMDQKSYDYLSKYQGNSVGEIVCVNLSQLMNEFPILTELKQQRSIVEFYFSCSPFICSYVFLKEQSCALLTYLDADLYFFSSAEKIYEEIGDASVAIIEHKFHGWGKRYMKYGRFNVGWVSFRRDTEGQKCLKSWLNDCQEWCFDYYDEAGQRFGDQKYLDKWEHEFSGVKIIKQKGANVAPWNAGQYKISKNAQNQIFIDQDVLVFYHFASFKKIAPDTYTTSMSRYMVRPCPVLKTDIYKKYLNEVAKYSEIINKALASDAAEVMKKNRTAVNQNSIRKSATQLFTSFRRWYYNDYIYK
ncbi:hypothetical protein [Pedobacter gandavensis]|uniref:hypothetical protein n=1 Tax=Pedobacter gandavensis TaxID=2679963 RepID=UPI0029319BAB|nr:hypothetical protein [Pedobacter gandavensis]